MSIFLASWSSELRDHFAIEFSGEVVDLRRWNENGAEFKPVCLFGALCVDFDLGRHVAEVDHLVTHLSNRFLENDVKPVVGRMHVIHATQEGSTAMRMIFVSGIVMLDAMP